VEGLEQERLNKVVADSRYDLACMRAPDPDCLNVMKGNTDRHRPQCVFGCKKKLITDIEALNACAKKWRDIRIARGENKADAIKAVAFFLTVVR